MTTWERVINEHEREYGPQDDMGGPVVSETVALAWLDKKRVSHQEKGWTVVVDLDGLGFFAEKDYSQGPVSKKARSFRIRPVIG